jgi:hypothetical protein
VRPFAVVAALIGLPLLAALAVLVLTAEGETAGETLRDGASRPESPLAAPSDPAEPAFAAPSKSAAPEHTDAPPAPALKPGSARLVPVDLTRVAPPAYGSKPWARLVTTPVEWLKLFEELHAPEWRSLDPLEGKPQPPPMGPAEVIVVVGLGERPRMDYDVRIEPVEPRGDELRLRLTVEAHAGLAPEVVTRPAFAYRIPRASIGRGGVVVADEGGYEIAALVLPAR